MGFPSNKLEVFTQSQSHVDAILAGECPFDKKTDELLCFAFTMREEARADACWTHSAIGDLVETRDFVGCGSCG